MRRTFRNAERPEHAQLGKLLKDLREQKGLTQRDIASRLGRTHAYLWKIEQGIQQVDIPTLIDLAKLYGTTASELVRLVEQGEQ